MLSLTLAHSIPVSLIEGNVEKSAKVLKEEGFYPKEYAALQAGQSFDNYTTYYMLNSALVSNTNPLIDALTSPLIAERSTDAADFDRALTGAIENIDSVSYYFRYWHGYLTWLTPLLIFFDVRTIRLICQASFFLLLFVVIGKLTLEYGKKGLLLGIILGASYVFLGAAQAAQDLPVFSSFALSMVGCLLALWLGKGPKGKQKHFFTESFRVFLCFAFLGVLTAFFDFLDTPILTLCAPLTVYLFCQVQVQSNLSVVRMVVFAVVGWFLAYGCFWASKWVLASLVLGPEVWENVLHQAEYRGGFTNQVEYGPLKAVVVNLSCLGYLRYVQAIIGMSALLVAIVCAVRYRTVSDVAYRKFLACLSVLFIVGCLPYGWYMALSNHSIIHAPLMVFWSQIGALFPWSVSLALASSFVLRKKKK